MGAFIQMEGRKYGRLLVIERSKSQLRTNGSTRTMWLCKCKCGKTKIVQADSLSCGITKSCGCLYKEKIKSGMNLRHGMFGTPEYNSWASMKERCLNPNFRTYFKYGDLKICKEWMEFNGFYKDMGSRPVGTTLDRIDPEGNYTQENCKWSTPVQQRRNQSATIINDERLRLGLSLSETLIALNKFIDGKS